MARVQFELKNSLTLTTPRGTLRRGEPVVFTDPADIAYFQTLGGVVATALPDQPERKKAQAVEPTLPPAKEDAASQDAETDGAPARRRRRLSE